MFAAHGLRLFDVEELPTHGGSLRIYARHAGRRRQAETERGAASCARASERPGSTDVDTYLALRRSASQQDKREILELPDRAQATQGKRDRRLRRAGEGQHAAQLLRHRHRLHRLHGRPRTRTSRAASCPARHIPIRAPEAHRARPARLRADPAVEPEGRDHASSCAYIREWGGRFVVRDRPSCACSRDRSTQTPLAGAFVVELERLGDERGFFARTWPRRSSPRTGSIPCVPVQHVVQRAAGTLRGMHYQAEPHEEAKLVRCTRGAIYDVAVDLRPDSPTYRALARVELTADNGLGSLHPGGLRARLPEPGRASEVLYLMSATYLPGARAGCAGTTRPSASTWPAAPRRAHDLRARSDLARPPDVSRVLVTGARGFLGRHAVDALLKRATRS